MDKCQKRISGKTKLKNQKQNFNQQKEQMKASKNVNRKMKTDDRPPDFNQFVKKTASRVPQQQKEQMSCFRVFARVYQEAEITCLARQSRPPPTDNKNHMIKDVLILLILMLVK